MHGVTSFKATLYAYMLYNNILAELLPLFSLQYSNHCHHDRSHGAQNGVSCVTSPPTQLKHISKHTISFVGKGIVALYFRTAYLM